MNEGACLDPARIREILASGEGAMDAESARHLEACEACRGLLERVDANLTRRWRDSLDLEGLSLKGEPLFREAAPAEEATEVRFPRSERPDSLGRLDGFEVLERLGGGSMGTVYRAWDVGLGREVALKVPRPELAARPDLRRRFEREARLASAAVHENLVRIYAVGGQGAEFALPYLVMELIRGESLAAVLAREGRLGPGRAADLVRRVGLGLDAAHATGLVHRDVKPSNILIEARTERPLLADFGVAKPAAEDEARLTIDGARIGTPAYMSPELCSPGGTAGPRSDVFSLGAVLYEAITGERPFRGATAAAVMRQIEHEEPVPPRRLDERLPRDLETICLKCLAKEPGSRYESARALAEELGRFLRGEPIHARPAGRAERLARWARRHPELAAATAAAVAGGALVVALSVAFGVSQRRAAAAIALERDRADTNLARAREAVDRMLTRVAGDRLDRLPADLGHAREGLLRDALEYQLAFLRDRPEDSGLRLDACRARLRAADIQLWLGRLDEAEASYRRGLAELDSLDRASPGQPEVARERAGGLHNFGHLLGARGRDREAVDAYRRSLSTREQVAASTGADEDGRKLVQALDSLGSQLVLSDREEEHAEAAALFDRGRALAESLLARRPDSEELRVQLGAILHNAATDRHRRGDMDGVLRATRRAIEVVDAPRGETIRASRARLLARVLDLQAQALSGLGKAEDAERAYRSAESRLADLASGFPDEPQYRFDVAAIRQNLGNLLQGSGKQAEAVPVLTRARDALAALAAAYPSHYEYREALATACNSLGNAIRTTPGGDPARAEASFRQGLGALAEAQGEAARRPDYRSSLAMLRHNLGDLLHATKKGAEAVPLLRQAVEDERAALDMAPTNRHYRQALSDHYWSLAEASLALRRREEAAAAAEAMPPLFPDRPAESYYAAGFLSRCAAIALNDPSLPAESRAAKAEEHAARAVRHLKAAVEHGFADAANLRTAQAFAPLRGRADFAAVLASILGSPSPAPR
ncbi:Serine/threonine-protein kinase PknB [Aquisphaera giovannonii]|uniref:non-specific serine/threonine protein kinase n=1 Tax=Aquisphaera giovannonii TaxID=406548 RepID=A0A5B9VX24_9BACT|nr:serine/threonine-protein kinase [Aquisphaera giovannonii]QEH32936.1 Serine/threonine-protein kinase PknB [Aquisphaera giovannonii]